MIKRKFMYIGENESDNFFDFIPVNGEVYDGSTVVFKGDGCDPDYTVLDAASASFNDWEEVGQEAYTEHDFINKCAIAAMQGLTSNPNIDNQITDVALVTTSFNVAYAMNEERKKRLKKSSS